MRAVVSGSFLIPKYSAALARQAMPATVIAARASRENCGTTPSQQHGNQNARRDGIKLHQRVAPHLALAADDARPDTSGPPSPPPADRRRIATMAALRHPAHHQRPRQVELLLDRHAPQRKDHRRRKAHQHDVPVARQRRKRQTRPATRCAVPAPTTCIAAASARKKKYSGQMRRMRRT